MKKLNFHLWFDNQAIEASKFYESVFPNSRIYGRTDLKDTPSGDSNIISMKIAGEDFMLLNAGPYFKFNPSISFIVRTNSKEETDAIWNELIENGKVMMELGNYFFSPWYGWVEDKYGVSWQIFTPMDSNPGQQLTPTLMFAGKNAGKAEEAINFYTQIFKDSKINMLYRYEAGSEPDKPGTIMHASFTLEGIDFSAMDSARTPDAEFNEAISIVVNCKDQDEIDYYWNKLSAHPESEQCGWIKDKYGVSWQIVPTEMGKMLSEGTPDQISKVTQAFLKMKKFDIAQLRAVYNELKLK